VHRTSDPRLRRKQTENTSHRLAKVRFVCDGLPLWVPYRTLNDAESSLVNSHPRRSDDKLVHVISIGDLVKDIISEQKFVIEQLDNYIAGHR
jgi:hypothetical protein